VHGQTLKRRWHQTAFPLPSTALHRALPKAPRLLPFTTYLPGVVSLLAYAHTHRPATHRRLLSVLPAGLPHLFDASVLRIYAIVKTAAVRSSSSPCVPPALLMGMAGFCGTEHRTRTATERYLVCVSGSPAIRAVYLRTCLSAAGMVRTAGLGRRWASPGSAAEMDRRAWASVCRANAASYLSISCVVFTHALPAALLRCYGPTLCPHLPGSCCALRLRWYRCRASGANITGGRFLRAATPATCGLPSMLFRLLLEHASRFRLKA